MNVHEDIFHSKGKVKNIVSLFSVVQLGKEIIPKKNLNGVINVEDAGTIQTFIFNLFTQCAHKGYLEISNANE